MKITFALLVVAGLVAACGTSPPAEPVPSGSSSSSSVASSVASAPACTAATDCKGMHPMLCKQCPNGTQACAHWTCNAGACALAYCE